MEEWCWYGRWGRYCSDYEVECMFVFSTVNHFTFLPVLYSLEKKMLLLFHLISISAACILLLPTLFIVPGCCSGLLLVAVVACQ